MDAYGPLHDWLKRQPGDRVELLFDDIEDEDRIGVKLPRTAREKRAWWGNEFNARLDTTIVAPGPMQDGRLRA